MSESHFEPFHLVRLEYVLKNGRKRFGVWRFIGETDEALQLEYSSGKRLDVAKKDIVRLSFSNPWRYCTRRLFAAAR